MRATRVVLLIAVATVTLGHRSDGQPAQPVAVQLKLAGVMPRGAMVYVQARDLSALMKRWLRSPIRDGFYKSSSFTAFSQSRIYLKLQDRKKDFEQAIGFGLDENRLAELAGGASAVAVYDIGNLEIVFVTEVARERAAATALFKQLPQFEERPSEAGAYYVREVTTDGGRLKQQFCFAYAGGRLIVATTEGLMLRALSNANAAGSDSLLADVTATAEMARGFSAHDLSMWLDQTRLNGSRHFNSYWIHHNVKGGSSSLGNIETGVIDLRIAPEGLVEQRWFVAAGRGAGSESLNADQVKALMKFAPADAQLVEAHARQEGADDLTESVSHSLFGVLPASAPAPDEVPPDRTRSADEEGEGRQRTERYSRLDARFDRDVDDEQAGGKTRGESQISDFKSQSSNLKSQIAGGADRSAPTFAERIGPILKSISPARYCELARSKVEAGKPFIRYERAVVIETGPDSTPDLSVIERAITEELRSRFVVGGVGPSLTWEVEGDVRFLAQTLLEQGAALGVSGRYLVVASSREFARDVLQAGSAAAASTAAINGEVEYYAVIRVAAGRPVFDKLMSTLDLKAEPAAGVKEEEGNRQVKFFSENLSSLIAVSAFREVRLTRARDGGVMVETVLYSW